jgi:hypothetical protein
MWVRALGTQPLPAGADDAPYEDAVAPRLVRAASPFGEVVALAPVVELCSTPGHWARPPAALGASPPAWVG